MLTHTDNCADGRGVEYLKATLDEIAESITAYAFRGILQKLEMKYPSSKEIEADLKLLTLSVNPTRLKNNPVKLEDSAILEIYGTVVKGN